MRMWNCYRWMTTSLVLAALLAGPLGNQFAWAQKPKTDPGKGATNKSTKADGNQPGGSMEIATVEGKWDAFAQGIIKILNSENQEVFLQSENNTVLQYSAEAEPSWLMPGYMVRFSATFDQNSKATAPLKAIEVFTPVTHRHMTPEAMREQTPGIYREDKAQAGEAKGMFGNEGNNNATKNNANKNNVNNVNNKAQSKSKPSKKESAIAPAKRCVSWANWATSKATC